MLQLVAITAEAGQQAGKPVGVCGEAAADPLLACVLVGLGDHLAVDGPAAVRPVGAQLAGHHGRVRAAAEAALAAADPWRPPAPRCWLTTGSSCRCRGRWTAVSDEDMTMDGLGVFLLALGLILALAVTTASTAST